MFISQAEPYGFRSKSAFDIDRINGSIAMVARIFASALASMLMLASVLFASMAPAVAEGASTFRWRWQKILGPGDHPWTTMWRTGQSGPFCDHAGEGKFCGCSNTSACGRYDNGQEIATAPFGCDKPERWRLRCITEAE
jgi:hypothetical protein